jgi:dimethylamine monooxygenase subunit A
MTSDDPDLTALPDEDFRFSLGIREGDAGEFFGPSEERAELLAERRRWLCEDPARYAAALPISHAPLEELESLAAAWGFAPSPIGGSDSDRMLNLGRQLEPDLVLLAPDVAGTLIVVAGCVCFPSAWRLTDKMGRSLDEAHGPVPGLNESLGVPLNRFLTRMKSGRCWLRSNWGMASTPERNEHPDRHSYDLASPLDPEQVWVRREDQALLSLPASEGVLFGIRVIVQPLTDLSRSPDKARRLGRAIRTMSPAMLEYKGLMQVRDELIAFLNGAASS